jgi:hypothetical protein
MAKSMITITRDLMRRPRGRVQLFKRGRLLWEIDNLYVNAGLPVLANLLAAATAGYKASAIGFGSGNTAAALGDTDLTLTPKYYNAIGTNTIGPAGGIASGAVLFNYGLLTTDYAANPLTIQELGLFANNAALQLPAAVGTANPAWAASTAKVVGNLIVDSNGNIERCTTAGNTGTAAPTWATNNGSTTNDFAGGGTAVWTMVAAHTVPGPMIAHVVVPSFPYAGAANYAGTWTITM